MRHVPCVVALNLVVVMLAVPSVARAQKSQALRNCAATQTAATADGGVTSPYKANDQWMQDILRTFAPKPGAPSIRLITWEDPDVQDVMLARNGIVQVCASYLAGNTPYEVADETLSGFEQTYQDFMNRLGAELGVLAASGQVAQLDTIRTQLTGVAAMTRQAGFLGLDKTEEFGYRSMLAALVNFSRTFATSCYDQEFDPQIAVEIDRQNDAAGTKIDLMPCANRKFTSAIASNLTFESCTASGVGPWRVTWNFGPFGVPRQTTEFTLDANRQTASGNYDVTWDDNGVAYTASGRATLSATETRDAEGRSARTYRLKGRYSIQLTKGAQQIAMLQKLMGKKIGGKGPFDAPVKVSRKPCRSVDDDPDRR